MSGKTRIRSAIVLAAFVAFLFTAIAPPAKAVPTSDILTIYYDCAMNEVGWKYRGCDGTGVNSGQLSGYFREIDATSCEDDSYSDTFWKWNGSGWDLLPGEPTPEC